MSRWDYDFKRREFGYEDDGPRIEDIVAQRAEAMAKARAEIEREVFKRLSDGTFISSSSQEVVAAACCNQNPDPPPITRPAPRPFYQRGRW